MNYEKAIGGLKPESVRLEALLNKYRAELREHDICIQSYEELIKSHGLINIIKNILNERGIGDGCIMCAFHFPDIEDRAKGTDSFEGVRFSFTPDDWSEVITYRELVWLVEDSCVNYLRDNPQDKDTINALLEKVREKFNSK